MTKIVVTGGTGRIGKWVIRELLEHGYDVVSADVRIGDRGAYRSVLVDARKIGDVYYALQDASAVIHLAAIPSPGRNPDHEIIENNVVSTYNVLEAASVLGIQKVVLASSICAYGMVNARHPFNPQYLPLDEDHPLLPQDSYGLSKVMDEQSAQAIHRRTGMQVVCLRLSTVIDPELYAQIDPVLTNWLHERVLWSYVDVRDVARAFRLSVEADNIGFAALNIGAADIGAAQTTRELLKAHFGTVTDIRQELEPDETPFAIDRAKAVIGWEPLYSWRKETSR